MRCSRRWPAVSAAMAAIAAADGGANVILCDKTNPLRSGSGATGNDHFACYLYDSLHKDMTIDDWVKEFDQSMVGGHADPSIQKCSHRAPSRLSRTGTNGASI